MVSVSSKVFYETCPHFKHEAQSVGEAHLKGIKIYFYNEQFTRMLSYFLNRFLWAITDADPYARQKVTQNIDDVHDLKQLDLLSEFKLHISDASLILPERPYKKDEVLALHIRSVTMTQA